MHSNPIEVKSRVLGEIRDDRLSKGLQNLPSAASYRAMNKIGKPLRDEPTLGRVMASKKDVYVDA
jgi:hypothetical protein